MFFALSKLLSILIAPLTWVFLLLIVAWRYRKRKRRRRSFIWAMILLYFFSNGFISRQVTRWWEGPASPNPEMNAPYAAAIVLGGFSSFDPAHQSLEFNRGADRLLHAMRLYHEGTVKKVIISGGSGMLLHPDEKEGHFVRDYLLSIGFPEQDLIIESESRNTHENARYVKAVARQSFPPHARFLLVTSAGHMARAEACFTHEGINADPFKVDFSVGHDDFSFLGLILPSGASFDLWNRLIHEWVGYLMYAIKGYL